jgi:ssDNA-binding Zn-finger/Zn-ribbon topoisomerase 1
MRFKTGKFGPFFGCSRYPGCNGSLPLQISYDVETVMVGGQQTEVGILSVNGVDFIALEDVARLRGAAGVRPVSRHWGSDLQEAAATLETRDKASEICRSTLQDWLEFGGPDGDWSDKSEADVYERLCESGEAPGQAGGW